MREETSRQAQTLELSPPQRLNGLHDVSHFDCGQPSINEYLQSRALKAQAAKHAVIYVVCVKGTNIVAAYYTLSNASVARQFGTPARMRRNAPDDLPVTVLGRLGVTAAVQGRGVAQALLADAIERALVASEVIGSVALVVHPLSDDVARFYEKYAAFRVCPDLSPVTMMRSLR